MSTFKRANWHSELTYKQTCPSFQTTVTYKDNRLGFRPLFPNGFVYCPTYQKPLRHNENLAIHKRPEDAKIEVDSTKNESNNKCSNCGKQLRKDDNFCSECETKH